MKKIVLTGGGTAGHVTPNIALLPDLQEAGYEVAYIGSYEGIEKRLIEPFHIPYTGISTGKFRRYFDVKNFSDPFRVIKGYQEAKKYLKEYQPDVVFSKGGYVSVPVVRAAAALKIPCVIHESDMTPGLANKLCIPVASKICCNFPETMHSLPKDKAILTGSPIRKELLTGDPEIGYEMCGFNHDKPIILVIGGSLGASAVNQAIRDALPKLLEEFQVVHLCGKDKMDNLLLTVPGYKQFEYITDELKHLFAMADLIISRAGANAICEILTLNKPNILIPLPSRNSRGDQLLNAQSFVDQGFSVMIDQDDLCTSLLIDTIHEVREKEAEFRAAMEASNQKDAIEQIIGIIEEAAKKE